MPPNTEVENQTHDDVTLAVAVMDKLTNDQRRSLFVTILQDAWNHAGSLPDADSQQWNRLVRDVRRMPVLVQQSIHEALEDADDAPHRCEYTDEDECDVADCIDHAR